MSDLISKSVLFNAIVTAKDKADCFAAIQAAQTVDAVEWHKVVMRKMAETDYDTIDVTDLIPKDCFICDMPNDGQKILVVMPWGTDCDVCIKTPYGYGLMYESGWHDVIAWAETPKYEED